MVCYINIHRLRTYLTLKWLLSLQQNIDDVYICSGLVATSSFETQFQKKCLIGYPGKFCCIEGCSANCDKDCQENGYKNGSFCDTIGTGNVCCCFL
jgi:hypothetical protein